MKRNLTKSTNFEAWDRVMEGAFSRVFSKFGENNNSQQVVEII